MMRVALPAGQLVRTPVAGRIVLAQAGATPLASAAAIAPVVMVHGADDKLHIFGQLQDGALPEVGAPVAALDAIGRAGPLGHVVYNVQDRATLAGVSRTLKPLEIVKLLASVGFPDTPAAPAPDCPPGETNLERATRIVLGESGGNPLARLDNLGNRGVDRGLFQINSRAWPGLSDADAFDPEKNARYAFKIWKLQKGFRPEHSAWWGGAHFHSRIYRKGGYVLDTSRLQRARRAIEQWRAAGRPRYETTETASAAKWLGWGAAAIGLAAGIWKIHKLIKG